MKFSIHCQYLLDNIRKMKDIKSLVMPKELMITLNESKSGPSLMTLVEEMSTLVEGVTMTTQSLTCTTIHGFFSNPIQWPETTKLKRLVVQLRAEEPDIPTNSPDTKLENFASIKDGGLKYLCIIFNAGGSSYSIRSLSKLIKTLPAFSQIAAGMLKVGGTGCEYALKVTGTLYGESKEQEMGEMLTTLLRREMMEIWKQQPQPVGWRRLTREE
ncbi:uncharacterized protein L199_001806 [Kwoniella botswanensis]|uniref:uncharacterized protein n=1 Tax=Kwoniella botswanensis TaxID=1268659 RepID=UPI00315CF853